MKLRRSLAVLLLLALLAGCGTGTVLPEQQNPSSSAGEDRPAEEPAEIIPPQEAGGEEPSETPEPAEITDPSEPSEQPRFEILFINTGRSDAILLKTDTGAYLVDTGLEETAYAVLGACRRMGVSELDTVFITHSHNDHIGGLEILLRELPVRCIARAEIGETNKKGENPIDGKAGNHPVLPLCAGDTLQLGTGITATVLGPLTYDEAANNNNSLVLLLETGNRRYLLAGDMEFDEEDSLLAAGIDLQADVLKVGNHGNPDATGKQFARAVDPAICVITTDRSEDEDSANKRVLKLFSETELYITDETENGLLISEDADGILTVTEPESKPACSVGITAVDYDHKTITIKAEETADLSGWMLVCEKGNALFRFPEGTLLREGETVTAGAEGSSCTYCFAEAKPFSAKKPGIRLYDAYGSPISAWD